MPEGGDILHERIAKGTKIDNWQYATGDEPLAMSI